MNTHSTEQDPDTQDANMKDAPSCEKCGKIFPWNQRCLFWKHMQECTGPAESVKSVAKPTPLDARRQTLPLSTQIRYTGSFTTSGSSESYLQQATTDEDAPKCEKCGRIFPWNQVQLRWKHKCEQTEVGRASEPPRRRIQSSVSNLKRPVAKEESSPAGLVEKGARTVTNDATLTCKCGKSFPENQRRKFLRHKPQCQTTAKTTGKHHC